MNRHQYNRKPAKRCGGNLRGIIAAVMLCVVIMAPFAVRGEDIFAELTHYNQVESTYVSGRFAHNMKTWRSLSGQHAMNLGDGFSSLYTYQCYSQETVSKARKILDNYLSSHKDMELMMRTKHQGGEYLVYEQFNKEDKLVRMIIWNNDSPGMCEVVVVDWKNGLVRDTSSFSDPSGLIIDGNGDTWFQIISSLDGLEDLSELKNLEKLSELNNLEKLSELSKLGNISEISVMPENMPDLLDIIRRATADGLSEAAERMNEVVFTEN